MAVDVWVHVDVDVDGFNSDYDVGLWNPAFSDCRMTDMNVAG
jgi:hypothetical protein